MKKIDSNFNKGYRLFNDDIRFLQSAFTESFAALISAYNINFTENEIIILSGLNRTVSGGIVTYSEGYVIWNHEVCKVEEVSFPIPVTGFKEVFIHTLFVDAEGIKISDDGLDTHYAWKENKITIITAPNSSLAQSVKVARHFSQVIKDSIPQTNDIVFRTFTDSEFGTGDYTSEISIGIDGMTVLKGIMMFTDVGAGDIVANIPVGFRPLYNIERPISYFVGTTLYTIIMKINTAGEVRFTNAPTYSIVFDFGQVLGWKTI